MSNEEEGEAKPKGLEYVVHHVHYDALALGKGQALLATMNEPDAKTLREFYDVVHANAYARGKRDEQNRVYDLRRGVAIVLGIVALFAGSIYLGVSASTTPLPLPLSTASPTDCSVEVDQAVKDTVARLVQVREWQEAGCPPAPPAPPAP